jgi:chromosome segregation protein
LQEQRQGLDQERSQLAALLRERSEQTMLIQQTDRTLAVTGERERSLAARRADQARQHEDSETTRRDLLAQQAQLVQRTTQTAGRRTVLEADLRAAETALQPAARLVGDAQQQWRSAVDAGLADLRAVTALRAQIEQLELRTARAEQDRTAGWARLEGSAEALAAAAADVQRTDAAEQQAAAAVSAAAAAEQAARATLAQARAARSDAEEQRAQLRRTLADLQARFESLTRLQRQHSGVFAGVKAAMEWADRRQRRGFVLVQQLLETPAVYETAVEAALGARLQHIVVDTWRDAEDAIAELRRSGVGRATFLPLDTLRVGRRDQRGPTESDGVFGVAADLVTVPEPYSAVREQLLGRLLLVRDLPIARREVNRLPSGWQIATTAGDLVNSGGSVSGGAPVREQGALRRERETRELPAQIASAEQQLRTADDALRAAETAVQQAQSAVQAAEQALVERRRRQSSAVDERDRAAARQRDLAEQRRRLDERLAELERELMQQIEQTAAARAQLAALSAAQAARETEQQELARRVETARDAEQSLRQQVNDVRTALAAVTAEQTAQRNELQQSERRLQQLADLLQRAAATAEELAEQAAGLTVERQRITAALAAARDRERGLLALIEPLERQLTLLESAAAAADDNARREAALLLTAERDAAQSRADLQRAVDRADAVFERAVADDVDPEQGDDAPDVEPVSAEQLEELRGRLLRLGSVNLLALEEYRELQDRHTFLSSQSADLRNADATVRLLIQELEQAMNDRFSATFTAVAAAFSETFPRLFGGGSAQLQLVQARSNDEAGRPAEGNRDGLGVEVLAQPPGKRRQPIGLLSGGERSLTAAALLFAILQVNPSPFCILDETDAALDESNVGRFRAVLAELTGRTQFIMITHNRGTVEAADHLYGVTLGDDGSSRVVSLQVAQYVKDSA